MELNKNHINKDNTWVCSICGKDTSKIEYDYIGSGTNHLQCELKLYDKKVLNANPNNNEGETCIHNNSWHSECMECNSESLIDDIFSLVREYSNDSELGAKVRELYYSYTATDSDAAKADKDRKR